MHRKLIHEVVQSKAVLELCPEGSRGPAFKPHQPMHELAPILKEKLQLVMGND